MLINIAIDGPAGSGKTAVGVMLAKKINYAVLDSGIFYRCYTKYCLDNNLSLTNKAILIENLNFFTIQWKNNELLINNEKISSLIYQEQVTKNIHYIADIKEIRLFFNQIIRKITAKKGFVVMGRDITSIVLKDAELKFFLTSSLIIRSERRWKDYQKKGLKISFDEVVASIAKRDFADENRMFGKLIITADTIIIDNNSNDLLATVNKMAAIYQDKIKALTVKNHD